MASRRDKLSKASCCAGLNLTFITSLRSCLLMKNVNSDGDCAGAIYSVSAAVRQLCHCQRAKFINQTFAVECALRKKIEGVVTGDQKKPVRTFENAPVILPAQIRFDVAHLKKYSFFAEQQ